MTVRRPPKARALCLAGIGLLLVGAIQRPAVGSEVPWGVVLDGQDVPTPLETYAGPRGLVVLFWAGWSDRSLEELKHLDELRSTMADRGVGFVAVNVERESAVVSLESTKAKAASLGVTIPLVRDDGLKLFGAYGVVSVPSTAVVDGAGKLVLFVAGYGHEQRQSMVDVIERLAGVEHAAPAAPTLRAAPAAVRRLLFGRAQLAGGRVAAARSSFEAAMAADPGFAEPLVELAGLDLDAGDLATAELLLSRAEALVPGQPGVAVERARAQFLAGRLPEAATALEALGSTQPLALAYFGLMRLTEGRVADAEAMFSRLAGTALTRPRDAADMRTLTAAEAATDMAQCRRSLLSQRQ